MLRLPILDMFKDLLELTNKRLEFTPKINSPRLLYVISYANPEYGFRCVQDGYPLGSFVQDYIFEDGLGTLDRHNGRFAVTPDYPNGTYAYFMSTDSSDNPVYPYVIGPEFYGEPYHSNEELPILTNEFPAGAKGEVVLNPNGSVGYVRMVRNGDGYFGPAKAKIIGGEGTGATAVPTVQTVTGLTLYKRVASLQLHQLLFLKVGEEDKVLEVEHKLIRTERLLVLT